MMVITKADGENLHKAELARTQFQSALRLFPMPESEWRPRVYTCSSVDRTGLEGGVGRRGAVPRTHRAQRLLHAQPQPAEQILDVRDDQRDAAQRLLSRPARGSKRRSATASSGCSMRGSASSSRPRSCWTSISANAKHRKTRSMNLMKRSVAALAGAVCCLAAAACSDESTVPTPKPAAVVSQIRYVPAEGSDEDRTPLQFLYGEERRVRLMNSSRGTPKGHRQHDLRVRLRRRPGGSWAAAPHRARSCSTGEGAAPRSATSAAGRCVRCATTPADTTTRLPRTKGGASMSYHLIGDRCNLFRIAEYAGAEQGDARKRSEVRFEYGTQPNDVNLDLLRAAHRALHDPCCGRECLMPHGVGRPPATATCRRPPCATARPSPTVTRTTRRGGPCASRSAAGRRVRRMPASSGSGTSNTTTSTASESAVCRNAKSRNFAFARFRDSFIRRGRWSGCGRFPGLAVRRGRGCSAVRVRFSGLAVRRCAAVRRDLVIRRGRWPEPAVGRGRPERALRLLTRCRGRGMRRSGPRERCLGVAMRRQPLLRSRSIAASEGMPTAARSRMWVFALRIAEVSGSPGSIR